MLDISSLTLGFVGGKLDRVNIEAEIEGYQLEGGSLPKETEEDLTKAAEDLWSSLEKGLKKQIREGLKG